MTKAELRKAKQDFHIFVVNLLRQYDLSDSECYILYGSFLQCLSNEIIRWGYLDKESEDDE